MNKYFDGEELVSAEKKMVDFTLFVGQKKKIAELLDIKWNRVITDESINTH